MKLLQRFAGRFMPRAETTTLRSPATWFLEAMFGQREASSGVRVSDSIALGLSAYYCGINMISGTVASLPLNAYKTDGRKREVWAQHPAHYLLHTEPNPEMTAMSFRQSLVFHAIHRGNAYAEILWDSRGNPQSLWPICQQTKPRRDQDGQLWYEVTLPTGEKRYLKPEDVLHIPGLGYDGIMGYGLMQLARESIGLNAGQDQYAAKFFRNGGNISGVVETDKILNDTQFSRLKSEIAHKLQGLTNAHRIALLENGMKFKPMNPTHEEAQLIEARRFTVEEWARWLNMPPHKLREMTHATFSNIEHQNIEWVVDTIRPWLVRFEQEFNRKLFRKQSVFYTKHVVEGLLRGDLKSRYDAYAIARTWGWMSANDVLELEDRNPLPGKLGDMYLVPLNMTPAEMAGKPPPGAPPPPAADPAPPPADPAVGQRLARAAAERVVRFESRMVASSGAAAYVEVGRKAAEWMCIAQDVADRYCAAAMQLNLLADDGGISVDELKRRKVEFLQRLATGIASPDATLKALTELREDVTGMRAALARREPPPPSINVDARTTVHPALAPSLTVNMPEQKAGDVKVDIAPADVVVNVERQDINVSQPDITVEAPQVNVSVPERETTVQVDAPVVNVAAPIVTVPEREVRVSVEPAVVNVAAPVVNVAERQVHVDVAPAQVNVTVPKDAVKLDVTAQVAAAPEPWPTETVITSRDAEGRADVMETRPLPK